MKNKLIDELEKTIEFLHQTGWHKQAVWYENKLKLIKESISVPLKWDELNN